MRSAAGYMGRLNPFRSPALNKKYIASLHVWQAELQI